MKYERTHHILNRNGKSVGHVQTDTIFINDIPHLVMEWEVCSDGTEKPAHDPVPLDPAYHHEINWSDCKYMYELPIDDPRKMN